jgi:hypothetical protein
MFLDTFSYLSYLTIEKNDISKQHSLSEIKALKRNPEETWKIICEVTAVEQSGGTLAAKEQLLKAASLGFVGCFWGLKIFRQHYFNRFLQCMLHLLLLGMLQFLFRFQVFAFVSMLNFRNFLQNVKVFWHQIWMGFLSEAK